MAQNRGLLLTTISMLLALPAHAQKPESNALEHPATVSFDVASVKPNRSGAYTATGSEDAGRFVWGNTTLMSCILYAYRVLGYQVIGPGWLDSERYDIEANKPLAATEEQVRVMLQNLITERFKLKLHREKKEMSVYALRVGKQGVKFQPSGPTTASQIRAPRNGVEGLASSMAGLSYLLMRWTDRIVVDETGLTGLYDFKLTLNADGTSQHAMSLAGELAFALHEQLGLTLEAKNKPIEVLVIDDVQRIPVPN